VIADPPIATAINRDVAETPSERSLTRDRVVGSLQLLLAIRRQARSQTATASK
jgi:hypothetical protein